MELKKKKKNPQSGKDGIKKKKTRRLNVLEYFSKYTVEEFIFRNIISFNNS